MTAQITTLRPTTDPKLSACRRIFASDTSWGPVGQAMILRGEFDEEPEMARLLAAFEEGQRHVS